MLREISSMMENNKKSNPMITKALISIMIGVDKAKIGGCLSSLPL